MEPFAKSGFKPGFTLAELLIALAILGVIATFTIPKVLVAQQNGQNLAKAKEVAGMVAGAFQAAVQAGTISSSTKPSDLAQYINYVSIDTSGRLIDGHPGIASSTCNSTYPCMKLHNGGYLWLQDDSSFGGTSNLHMIAFRFDPDPANNTTSTSDGPLKAVQFQLYYNGMLRTRALTFTGSCDSNGCTGKDPNSAFDPSWFSW
jgi:prepilin-type N-terminal cleavage/methylation domain-containing protein